MMKLAEAAAALGAETIGGDVLFQAVNTDTRTIQPGDLFIALRGEHFDGHVFVAEAAAKGAVAALVSEPVETALPLLRVADTRLALGQLGAAWRTRFAIPLIAVTGSNGKTTTKEMLAAIFARRGPVLATQGNLNNDIGVPLTLLRLRAEHRCAVIEMGANHPGEIAYLSELARPTVALITNAAMAHLAGFGSLDEIARTKGGIYAGLAEQGVGIVNADDAYAGFWRSLLGGRRCMTFGMREQADVSVLTGSVQCQLGDEAIITAFQMRTPAGDIDVSFPLMGEHNVMNALAAAAAALAAGATLADVKNGLEAMQAVKGRLQVKKAGCGARVIDDTYNANPPSLLAAINVLAGVAGRKVLVLGDMGELGDDAPLFHRQVGERARQAGIDKLYATGELSRDAVQAFGADGGHYANHDELIAALAADLNAQTTVLVKGSRFMRMERVVEALVQEKKV
ncbi:MAG: UDP-N-acetylmuramoyl-tripeptide--D-alanyl-D-alanine ligase [Gammaproteobacteria bacterium]|nr:UDP-N-acetylmuramoyl-tripeptide--D-alanyl-D-alanine ligase [Gammaproteobacteria bacterium]